MSRSTVARILRVNYLIQPFKDMINTKVMALRVSVELSYISEDVQIMVYGVINDNNKKIDIKLFKATRNLYDEGNATLKILESLIVGEKKSIENKSVKVFLNREVFSRYFDKKTSANEIADTIKKALELYFNNNQ